MGQIIDISGKITNELPMVKITDELVVTVNNRKNDIMNMQAMILEEQRKAEKGDGTFNEIEMIGRTLEMLVGKNMAKEIENMNLPLPDYKTVYTAVMAAATGSSIEDAEKVFR